MLHGTVQYTLKNGKDASVDWGARAQMAGSGSGLKMRFYQVYLVRLQILCWTVLTDDA